MFGCSHHRERQKTDDLDELDDVEMVDESVAAMALTNLSCSPASPLLATSFPDRDLLMGSHSYRDNCGHLSSSVASSGFYSGVSEGNDRSPPMNTHLSESAPERLLNFEASPTDDCLDLEEDVKHYYYDDDSTPLRKKQRSQVHTEIRYQCTWPKCKTIYNTVNDIERHVRTAHLGRDSDSELSDDEEEFYFTEVEVNIDNVTEKFSYMTTSSPPSNLQLIDPKSLGVFDHDYQRKEHRHNSSSQASSVPSPGFHMNPGMSSTPIPIKVIEGNVKRSLSWQNSQNSSPNALSISSPIRSNRLSPQARLQQHQAQSPKSHLFSSSPKSNAMHRKPRSEVRKCRKIYGMENRDQWCTQCKWKKACSRFQD
ncbi:hypothetical protein SNE40_006245 [Patella caerulea]|uniref:C2H2-type domain-containing protein n=1 Tax=Patella caerulea TaxID=87958 RepID=A0AAN8JZZ3_PATCE